MNPKISEGLNGWSTFGGGNVETRISIHGNRFIVSSKRNATYHSFTQKLNMESHNMYTVSGTFLSLFIIICRI